MPDQAPPQRARVRTPRNAPAMAAALTAQGWKSRGAGAAKIWEHPGRARVLTITIDGEPHIFIAVERWPIEKIAAGPMPPL